MHGRRELGWHRRVARWAHMAASWFWQAHAAQERLKHKIHNTRIPLSRNGRIVAGCVYFSVPIVGGYYVMQWANSSQEERTKEMFAKLEAERVAAGADASPGGGGSSATSHAGPSSSASASSSSQSSFDVLGYLASFIPESRGRDFEGGTGSPKPGSHFIYKPTVALPTALPAASSAAPPASSSK